MSLPTISGRGFLISDGVTVAFSKAGAPWARLPLVFKNRKRNDDGSWSHTKEVLVEGTVFGPLAEWLADNVTTRQDLWVGGDLYTEEYEGKLKVKMTVNAAAPIGNKAEARQPVAAAAKSQWGSDDDVPF